jgi:YVTN family beta-propeller protein
VRWNIWDKFGALVLALVITVLTSGGPAARAADKPTRYFIAGSFGSNIVTVYNADTLKKVASIPTEVNGTCCVYATPNGRTLMAVAGLSAWVTTIDLQTLSVLRQTPVESDMFTESGSQIEDAGKTFWVTTNDGSPNIFGVDIAKGKVAKSFLGVESRDFQTSRDGKAMYLLTGSKLIIRSTKTGALISNKLAVSGGRAYVSLDDKTLYLQTGALSSGSPETIEVVDVSNRFKPKLVTTMPLPGAAWYGSFTPNGKELWVAGADNGLLTVFDLTTNTVKKTIQTGAYGVGVAISTNGRAFVTVTSTPIRPIPGLSTALHIAGVVPGAALPVATTYAGFPPGEVWVYDTKTYKKLDVPPLPLPSAAFGPAVVDNAPTFVPRKVKCTSPNFVWHPTLGCFPPNSGNGGNPTPNTSDAPDDPSGDGNSDGGTAQGRGTGGLPTTGGSAPLWLAVIALATSLAVHRRRGAER